MNFYGRISLTNFVYCLFPTFFQDTAEYVKNIYADGELQLSVMQNEEHRKNDKYWFYRRSWWLEFRFYLSIDFSKLLRATAIHPDAKGTTYFWNCQTFFVYMSIARKKISECWLWLLIGITLNYQTLSILFGDSLLKSMVLTISFWVYATPKVSVTCIYN